MWQLYALAAQSVICLESITDKRALKIEGVDTTVASFLRIAAYLGWTVLLLLLTGQASALAWTTHPLVMLLGLGGAGTSIAYTMMLRQVEVTTLAVLTYTAPLLLLVVDSLTGKSFSALQMLGMLLLVSGGVAFVYGSRLKLNWQTLGAFAYIISFNAGQAYAIQHFNASQHWTGLEFYYKVWVWSGVYLLAFFAMTGRLSHFARRNVQRYTRFSLLAKLFDALSSWWAGTAITLVAVSQVSSMEAFQPLLMLIFSTLAQKLFNVPLDEPLDKATLWRKVLASLVLVVGGFCVR